MSDRDNHSNRGRGKNRGSRGGSGGHNQGGRGGNKNKNNNKDRNHKPQGYSKQDKSKHNQQHRKKNYHENFPKQDNGPFKLRVTNAPHQVTTTDEVRAFLSTQSALPINSIEQIEFDLQRKGTIYITVADKTDSISISKMSNSKWKGQQIKVSWVKDDGGSKYVNPQILREIEELCRLRYDSQRRYLNLEGLQERIQPRDKNFDMNSASVMLAMFKILHQNCPDIQAINFASNHIRNLEAFREVPSFLGHLEVVSFENNKIATFGELDNLISLNLKELNLKNTNIQQASKPEDYEAEILHRFPTLSFLDGTKVEASIQFEAPASLTSNELPKFQPYFFAPGTKETSEAFLQRFLTAYDKDRTGLQDVYADTARFSVSSAKDYKKKSKLDKKSKKGQSGAKQEDTPEDDFCATAQYRPFNRNLLGRNLEQRRKQICSGRSEIVVALSQLPRTRHDFPSIKAEVTRLSGVEPMTCMHLYGKFWETEKEVNRCFSRHILMRAPRVNSPAHQRGWNAEIVSDLLHVRDVTGFDLSWASGPGPSSSSISSGSKFGSGSTSIGLVVKDSSPGFTLSFGGRSGTLSSSAGNLSNLAPGTADFQKLSIIFPHIPEADIRQVMDQCQHDHNRCVQALAQRKM